MEGVEPSSTEYESTVEQNSQLLHHGQQGSGMFCSLGRRQAPIAMTRPMLGTETWSNASLFFMLASIDAGL